MKPGIAFVSLLLVSTPTFCAEGSTWFTGDQGVRLAGTFSYPAQPVAAVVLLSVAGPTNRDMQYGPKSFYGDLAERLSEQGVASLRFDDRGVDESTGDWQQSTFANRGRDACGAMEHLKLRFEGVKRFGYIGMSEGGGIALFAHTDCSPGDFIAMLSTPLQPGKELMLGQVKNSLEHTSNISDSKKASIVSDAHQFLDLVTESDNPASSQRLKTLLSGPRGGMLLPRLYFIPPDPAGRFEFARSPWYRSQVKYDAASSIPDVGVPILAMYGSLDRSLDPDINSELARKLLPSGSRIEVIKDHNHLLQKAITGSPAEYLYLPGNISQQAVDRLLNWLIHQAL